MSLVDRAAPEPLTRQIYSRLRGLILQGTLAPGSRMTSTRRMAQELGVSRNVVLNAFDQLFAEGYLEARVGSGTFVAQGAILSPAPAPRRSRTRAVFGPAVLPGRVDFRSGLPDLERFPVGIWQRLTRAVWDGMTPQDLSYGQPEGRPELRQEIARYVAEHRGVRCGPEQVVVTAGTTQAAGIAARVLVSPPRSTCLLEDPLTSDIRRIIAEGGGRVAPVPVGPHGLEVEALPAHARPALVYVTPSHQFPTGATMPISSRVRLLEYARARDAYVVEDDYDSEFRYDAPPLASIQGLDPDRVVYIGTFSKTLCPALRLGYLIFPPTLVERGRRNKWFADLHNASPDQMVLARFIGEGHFARYVHTLKKVYRSRREALVEALERRCGGNVEVLGSPAGLHLCARFPGVRFGPALVREVAVEGAVVYPVEAHAITPGRFEDTLILGYGRLDERQIDTGIAALSRCLSRGRPHRPAR
jgi:GntR family transcriptional regulator/MocR family aminotransferase